MITANIKSVAAIDIRLVFSNSFISELLLFFIGIMEFAYFKTFLNQIVVMLIS